MKKILFLIIVLAIMVILFQTFMPIKAHAQTATCTDLVSCKAAVSTAYQEIHAADAILALLSGERTLPVAPICKAKDECGAVMADRFYAAALALGQIDRLAREAPFVAILLTGDISVGPYAVEAVTNKPNAFVMFQVDGRDFRKEGVAKFCMFGGDIACSSGRLGSGQHTIRAVLYDKGDPTKVLAEVTTSVLEP